LSVNFANNTNYKIYKYIRSFTKSASIPSLMFHDFSSITCDNEKARIFNSSFYFNFTKNSHDAIFSDCNPTLLSNITITGEDVYELLIDLDTSKAMGPDGILLSKCASALYKFLHYFFCLTLDIYQVNETFTE